MDCATLVGFCILIYIFYRVIDSIRSKQTIDDIGSRYILVTGCASGFGLDLIKRLDQLGCRVFAACRSEKSEDIIKKTCSNKVICFQMDISDPISVQKGSLFVKNNLPPNKGLWALVNNAGIIGSVGHELWTINKDYRDVFNTNFFGTVETTLAFLDLVKKENGRIVIMTSVLDTYPLLGSAAYTCSKFALKAFSIMIRRCLRPFNVSVHLIQPGHYHTKLCSLDRLINEMKQVYEDMSEQKKEEYGQDYCDKYLSSIRASLIPMVSNNISEVTDAYIHALFSCYPRTRYVCGFWARFVIQYLYFLPDTWLDFLFEKMMSILGLPLPLACKK